MRLRYTAEAQGHIAAIYNYIWDRSPAAAIQVAARIRLAAEQLTEFPRMGRIGAYLTPTNGSSADCHTSSSTKLA
jgi:plasmid stabilization system protein ParE